MASPSTVITLGYGSFGSVNAVPTLGYGIGSAVVIVPGEIFQCVINDDAWTWAGIPEGDWQTVIGDGDWQALQ